MVYYTVNYYYCGTGTKIWYADIYGDGEWYLNEYGFWKNKEEYDDDGNENDAYDVEIEDENTTFERLHRQLLDEKNITLNSIIFRKIHNSHDGTMTIKMDLTIPNNIVFSDSRKDIFI